MPDLSRRDILLAAAGVGSMSALATLGSSQQTTGDLTGGTMTLQEAYNVAGDLWIGPDSAKADVSPDSGRIYTAADTQVDYYGDGSSWVKMGIGSEQESVPAVRTDEGNITQSLTVDGDRVERLGPQQVVRAGLRDGLVGHWPLNNLSDGLEDTVNDNNISTTGSPTVSSNDGAFGDAVRFQEGEYGVIDHGGELSVEDGDFTIACYVRAYDLSEPAIAVQKRAQSVGDAEMSYALAMHDPVGSTWGNPPSGSGAAVAAFGDGSSVNFAWSDTKAGFGPLFPLVMTYDSQDNRITAYINGKSRATDAFSSPPVQNDSQLNIGVKFSSSGTINYDSDITISDLRIYDRKLSLGEIRTHARLPYPESQLFDVQRRSDGAVFAPSVAGPCYRYDDSKTDPHRLLVKDYNQAGNPVILYTAAEGADLTDSANWTAAATDIISGYTNADNTEPSDFVYDGSTYWVYMQDSTAGKTVVFSGSDWSSLTYDSDIFSDEDVGAYRDDDGTVYLYAEDGDNKVGVGSNKLILWTASSANGSFTEQRTVLDVTDKSYHTGDPDIEKIDGTYWMFTDNTENHPHYGTTLLRSTDLYNWEVVAESVKRGKAGDLEVNTNPNGLIAFAELSGGDDGGVDVWDVYGPQ